MSDIKIKISTQDNTFSTLEAPTDMGLSLMEFLKANEFDILATCGGMALCATCHVQILSGFDGLRDISDDEYAMLDTLPNITSTSRLSCQLRIEDLPDNIEIKIMGDGLN